MSPKSPTPRQREIIALLAEGLSYKEIGDRMGLSKKTVDNHIGYASLRMGLGNKPQLELVAWHYRQRIAEPEATIANLTAK
jgi:DNA-binding CsgD family transcriptional regulator